jgi:hypothetical protein
VANFFALVEDAVRRRIWLLAKALEHAPLAEALVLAQAAEDFVTTSAGDAGDLPSPTVWGVFPRVH